MQMRQQMIGRLIASASTLTVLVIIAGAGHKFH
jgi:hypothetical protein